MQDRFRFRAWYTDYDKNTEMIYDVQGTYDTGCCEDYPGSSHHDRFQDVLMDSNAIVMQCTGLKDKNGKLIYEGDIVTPVHTNATLLEPKITGQVISGKACFQIQSPHIAYNALQILNSEKAFEVIGNIYENPELLESEV